VPCARREMFLYVAGTTTAGHTPTYLRIVGPFAPGLMGEGFSPSADVLRARSVPVRVTWLPLMQWTPICIALIVADMEDVRIQIPVPHASDPYGILSVSCGAARAAAGTVGGKSMPYRSVDAPANGARMTSEAVARMRGGNSSGMGMGRRGILLMSMLWTREVECGGGSA
jgi:hypothetical protein